MFSEFFLYKTPAVVYPGKRVLKYDTRQNSGLMLNNNIKLAFWQRMR